ncbi:MAG: methionyl-tRNA formyltransferase [Bacillota bacterium]|nr:methionyl-tRNA formyltransferase [Bacillota bacterium]
MKYNIVFMGTPDFAVPSLEKLIEVHDVTAVFTQPDRPKGRGKKLSVSPVKEVAIEHNIPVFQPEKIKKEPDTIKQLKDMQPDFIIVVAFGQILPKEVLDIPKYACINLHASLLPKYRGAAPINWCIVNGEKKSGNTTMLMDVGLDTGDMLLKQEVIIRSDMTAEQLHDELCIKGADLLVDTIEKYASGNIVPEKQNDSESCYASTLSKETGKIDWNKAARDIHNLIRGLNPWPIAYTLYEDKIMKIYKSKVIEGDCSQLPGAIVSVSKDGIKVSTGSGYLLIEQIQFPGKRPMSIDEYTRGNNLTIGIILK